MKNNSNKSMDIESKNTTEDTIYLDWVGKFKEFKINEILKSEFSYYLYRLEDKLKEEYKSELLSCCNDAYKYFQNKNYYDTNRDLETLINELKFNIISENWWSIFYNVQRISEISADIIIKHIINQNLMNHEDIDSYKNKLKKKRLYFS